MGCQQLTYQKNNFLQVVHRKNGQVQKKNALDYFSGGMAMPNRNVVGDYRYDYQGTEKDRETGLNAFTLRLYDSRINRWLSPDPMGEFHSPYLAMDNNWINKIDPTGGMTDDPPTEAGTEIGQTHFDPDTGNTFEWDGRNWESDMAAGFTLGEVVIGSQNTLSIKVDGRELNPDNYALSNSAFPGNIASLYTNLVDKVGNDNFQFKITGGDRYIGDNGKVYSSTNNSWINKAGIRSPHIKSNGARAVDLRIKFNDGRLVPLNTVKQALKGTDLILDPNALPRHYSDKHYHLQLPNIKKFGGKY